LSIEAPEFVRWVQDDEDVDELVNEAKYRAWTAGAEHALLTLDTGERPMVKGGSDGIRFDVEGEGDDQAVMVTIEGRRLRVVRIEWHTHPRVTGPSDGDREAVRMLKQAASLIYEMGGDPDGTVFGPEKGKPRV
jgi:hypothetical protein